MGDLALIPGLGRSPGEEKGYPLQYSGLENAMDCQTQSQTERLSLHFKRLDARYWMLGAGELEWLRGMVRGGRREEGSGCGTRVYLWCIHVNIWQNQYNIVKLKN